MLIKLHDSKLSENIHKSQLIPQSHKLAFVLVTSLFFLWAIGHGMNDILIRQFQKALELSRGQASFVQVSFYLAYFFVAIPAGILMKKVGFKKAILIGLSLFAIGAGLFYPAAEAREYGLFLLALFILACGIVFLEIAGSGYITIAGEPHTAARRINFSQSFNGLGAITAPVIGGLFIFSGIEYSPDQLLALSAAEIDAYRVLEAKQVQTPYLIIAAMLIVIATVIFFTPFPETRAKTIQKSNVPLISIFKKKSFVWAIVGQFFYVGAQIGVWSYFIDFTIDLAPETSEKTAAFYLSGSLFLFMLGRFIGTYLMKYIQPRKLLATYALCCVFLTIIAIIASGFTAVIALILISLFMSIMFPTIYALGLEGLGENAEIGSSFIIMTIISGAMIPPIMGFLADYEGIQAAYLVPLICFLIVWIAAVVVKK
jgi:FHS family L-fucose permease-like MFS transporter